MLESFVQSCVLDAQLKFRDSFKKNHMGKWGEERYVEFVDKRKFSRPQARFPISVPQCKWGCNAISPVSPSWNAPLMKLTFLWFLDLRIEPIFASLWPYPVEIAMSGFLWGNLVVNFPKSSDHNENTLCCYRNLKLFVVLSHLFPLGSLKTIVLGN